MSSQETPPTDAGSTGDAPVAAEARPLSKELLTDEAHGILSLDVIELVRASVADSEDQSLAMAIRMVTEVLEANRACYPARLAQGLLQERLEDPTPAVSTFVVLARDLLEAGNAEAARWVARRGMSLRGDHRLVDVLLRIARQAPEWAEEDVSFCRERLPDAPELLWHDSQAADAAEDSLRAADLAVDAALGFVRIGSIDDAENAILRVLECEDRAVIGRLVGSLPSLVSRKRGREVLDLALELGTTTFEALGLHAELADALQAVLLKHGDDPSLRTLFVSSLAASLGGERAVRGLLDRSGLTDPAVPFPDALDRYSGLAVYLPGTHVLNADWGVGRVTGHDGEFLSIDFQHKRDHRLSLSIAETAISVVPENLVAVAYFEDPEGIERERDENPAALVLRAVQQEGGAISVKELKEVLTRDVVPYENWATWWRKAREALTSEPRIDRSQRFRDVIRLAPEGGSEVDAPPLDLPILDTKKGMKSAAAMINRLLKDYPDMEDRAKASYAAALATGLAEERSADARLAVLPLLARWRPDERATWVLETARALQKGGDVCAVTDERGQEAVMDLALESEEWQTAAVAGLKSKREAVVAAAWEALASRGEPSLRAALEAELTSALPPAAEVHICQVLLSGWSDLDPSLRPEPWLVVAALLNAATPGGAPKAADAASRLLTSSESLEAALTEASPPSRAMRERLRGLVRRGLDEAGAAAALGLFARSRHDELVLAIEAEEEVAEGPDRSLPEFDEEVTLMSRSTMAVLEERMRTNRERLRIVLDDLEKARGFGDLSENSEYETARDQRALLESTIAATVQDIGRARFIEDLEVEPDTVRVGTEVTVRDDAGKRTIWLLGEGDSHLGSDVVSYRAPLGQALVGRRAGDRVRFVLGDEARDIEILAVERRLPTSDRIE